MQKMFKSMALVLSVAGAKVPTALTNAWRMLIGGEIGIYWPEAHYMRGPGPKWRAKNIRPES